MKLRHFFAALLLAFGVGQHACADEAKKPEAQQDMQPSAVATQPAENPAGQEKAAVQGEPPVAATASSDASTKPAAAGMDSALASHAPHTSSPAASMLLDVKATDILLALFAGLLVLLGWIQARRMREAVAAANGSAAVAEKSARIAEDALVAGQRAFMFIREIKTVLHQDPETGEFRWTIHPIWANSGNTPTRGLSINTTYRLLDEPLPKDYDFPQAQEDLIPTIAGPRSMVEAVPGTLSSEDLAAVQSGRKYFYIWGWAEYHDIFEGTKKRVTRFCNQLIQVDGDPAQPANEHNPIQMMFGFHTENNYAD